MNTNRKSRSYLEIKDPYPKALAQGARAAGRLVPKGRLGSGAERRGDRLVARYRKTTQSLSAGVLSWSEKQLDTRTLHHPVLGRFTMRETMFLTVYHNWHHLSISSLSLLKGLKSRAVFLTPSGHGEFDRRVKLAMEILSRDSEASG
ncbi:MAG: DinB family protein [Deinococcus sp.]|nr:DinB family protein [Deinococcus sp.]